MTVKPLEGIRVLVFGTAVAGPFVGKVLCDWGAEVIKVESSLRPDRLRWVAPMKANPDPSEAMEISAPYIDYNSGFKSILVDMKNPKAIELLKKVISKCDALLDNFSPRVMKGLGLGYDDLVKVKPDIIQLSASGMGQTGPLNDLMTYGPTVAALSGMQSMLGYPDGLGVQDYGMCDFNAACTGAFLLMGAILYRDRTGKGQFIDLAQVAPMNYMLGEPLMNMVMNNVVTPKQGNRREGFAPIGIYRCKPDPKYSAPADQWVSIAVKTEEEWDNLCSAMGNPAWMKEKDFAERSQRIQNLDELDKLIGQWTINYTQYEAMFILQKAGVAAMVVIDDEGIPLDIHCKARETDKPMDSAIVKNVFIPAPPFKFSDSIHNWRAPSKMGEDHEYIFGKVCGLSKAEIDKLVAEKVII